ncbi:Os12g0630751 [Oryza sativa Japonica Group]|uniref:Os12g0630751 protein n=1 Tax=Oryza sativa subsp. japonica TaxID=39947 RepID=A0A0N7KUE7_ORYSJ|nr:Os12g0630751 [Oryza sativa Japonica Group]
MMSNGPSPVPSFQRIPDNNNNEKLYRMLMMTAVVAQVAVLGVVGSTSSRHPLLRPRRRPAPPRHLCWRSPLAQPTSPMLTGHAQRPPALLQWPPLLLARLSATSYPLSGGRHPDVRPARRRARGVSGVGGAEVQNPPLFPLHRGAARREQGSRQRRVG